MKPTPPAKIKVLIVHRSTMTRFGLLRLIESTNQFEVCAETDNAPTARELFLRHRPKLVVLGLTLSRGEGLTLIKEFAKFDDSTATLILSSRDDGLSIQRAFAAGARGYLLIDEPASEVLRALEEIAMGNHYASPKVLPRFIQVFRTVKVDSVLAELNTLSDRELEVFSLTGRGFGLSQLAKELGVSSKTIETHRERIKVKLRLGSTRELKEKAEQWAVKSARETLAAPSRKLSSLRSTKAV